MTFCCVTTLGILLAQESDPLPLHAEWIFLVQGLPESAFSKESHTCILQQRSVILIERLGNPFAMVCLDTPDIYSKLFFVIANWSVAELTASNGTSSPSMTWTPRTLRPGFLYLLSGSASLLSTVVTLLCWVSETKHGLGTDYRSSILLLGWKFSPSLITVLYVQLTAMLLDDVKRAEPFAGLARAGGSTALWTVLKVLGAWWNALYDGLSKNSTGRRNWLLISSAILNVVGFLAISPYHLPLLTPKKRPSKGRSISGEQLQRGTLHSRFEQTEVYLRTIARVLQNTAQECDSYVGVWSRELEDAQR